jgi:hypothetical protein
MIKRLMRVVGLFYPLAPVMFWLTVGSRYEPFRSHFWLTMFYAVLCAVPFLGITVLLARLLKKLELRLERH